MINIAIGYQAHPFKNQKSMGKINGNQWGQTPLIG